MQVTKQIKSFGGDIHKLSHESAVLKTPMNLNVFLPPQPERAPVLFYLAGLTCTGDNGLEKGGFLGAAAKHNIALVFPDTSPRTKTELVGATGAREHENWDFGSGAGFYVDATAAPWSEHYRMESYVVDELPKLLAAQYPSLDFSRVSLFGHSMGGHGALTLFLRHPGKYQSVSAFAPVSHPTNCPWGHKAFTNYLGSVEAGKAHDASLLLRAAVAEGRLNASSPKILVDQGLADQFYKDGQLQGESLESPCSEVRMHEGYDHSYFFISTFGAEHVEHHAKYLK